MSKLKGKACEGFISWLRCGKHSLLSCLHSTVTRSSTSLHSPSM